MKTGFPKHERLDLPARRADRAQDADFAPALGHEDAQAQENPERGDEDADGLQQVGDGKGLVEDAEDLRAQLAVGLDQVIAVGREKRPQFLLQRHGTQAGVLVEVEAETVDGGIVPVFLEDGPVDEDHAALRRVVEVDAGDAKGVRAGPAYRA